MNTLKGIIATLLLLCCTVASAYNFQVNGIYYKVTNKTTNENGKNTVEVTNKGEYDTDYSVLKFKYEPHPELLDFKKIHIKSGETKTVKF